MLTIIPLAYNQDVEEDVGVDEKIIDLIFEFGQIGYYNILSGGTSIQQNIISQQSFRDCIILHLVIRLMQELQ